MPPKPTRFNKNVPNRDEQVQQKHAVQDKMASIKSRGKPLGGVPPVKIPPLDSQPIDKGGPMHHQADILQDPHNPLSPYYDPQLSDKSEERGQQGGQMDPKELRMRRQQQQQQQQRQEQQAHTPMTQTLPPEAAADPRFRQGVGAAFAANQPGVPRQAAQPDPSGKPQLSQETLQGMKELESFQENAQRAQERAVVEQAKKGEEQAQEQIKEDIAKDLGIDDPEEFFKSLQKEMSDLDNPDIQKSVEDRLKPMLIEQLLTEGEARQDVPIVRGKFVVTFRTISGEEDLDIKRQLYGEKGSDRYLFDKMGLMQLTCGIHAINKEPLPSHLNENGSFDVELFMVKFKRVRKFPMPMLASLGVNFQWFDQRSRKLFIDIDEVKNG